MSSYLFVFGRTPDLALLELQSFFPAAHLITPEIALVEAESDEIVVPYIHRLGGTVKIARYEEKLKEISASALVRLLAVAGKKASFGISWYGGAKTDRVLLRQMKAELSALGVDGQYVEPQRESSLSSVVIEKKKVTELVIVPESGAYIIGKTLVVQPFELWSRRDYGRPHADPKAGMLPPKVARMAVNIAHGLVTASRPKSAEPPVLLDPFCGMGTVLSEGIQTGWNVVGSDISKQVIQQAHENLLWAKNETGATGDVKKMIVSEAVHLAAMLPNMEVDAIVTEPYMGSTQVAYETNITPEKVKNIIKGLEKLYIGCLRNWSLRLRAGGYIVIALPAYDIKGREYFVKKVIDMCENLGYTIQAGPIDYNREHAVVKRRFYILKKT